MVIGSSVYLCKNTLRDSFVFGTRCLRAVSLEDPSHRVFASLLVRMSSKGKLERGIERER